MMIELFNVGKEYMTKGGSVQALSDVNLKFEKGKFYGIMGPSGSGKSTLIQIIGFLVEPSCGILKFDGVDMTDLRENDKARFRKEKLGFIFQSFHLVPTLSVTENILLPLLINKKLSTKEKLCKVEDLLELLGISDKKKNYPSQLSNGEQQRVAIARAICNSPNIILADEPTASLDKSNTIKVLDMLKKFSEEGKCVIVVSHDEIIKNYADKIIYLNNGIVEVSYEDN